MRQSPGNVLSCKTKSSHQLSGLSGGKSFSEKHIGAIITASRSVKIPPKVRLKGFRATDNVETCALDSGACEAVLTPKHLTTQEHVRESVQV